MGGLARLATAHLRGAWRRTVAAAGAIVVAVTSCVVLTGTVSTQRLQVTREVASSYRSTYDILVRPKGATEARERAEGVVRPSFLSGHYGGITLEQVKRISSIPGVDVAAPVAVLGQTMRTVLVPVDVGAALQGRDHAMVRFGLEGMARNRTSRTANQSGYLYLTRAPLTAVEQPSAGTGPSSPAMVEHRGNATVTACLGSDAGGPRTSPALTFQEQCWSAQSPGGSSGTPRVEVLLSLPLTVQAVDPVAEARLTGLDRAIVQGRGLRAGDSFTRDTHGPAPIQASTAIMASRLPFDYQARIRVDQLAEATLGRVLATSDAAARRRLVLAATPTRRLATVERDAATTYSGDIVPSADVRSAVADQSLMVLALARPADVTFSGTSPLRPQVIPFDPSAWRTGGEDGSFLPVPSTVTDTGYRRVTVARKTGDTFVSFTVVGTYDPERLPRPSRLSEVPLETYRPSILEGADETSRAALGEKPMASDLSPAGYPQSPPALLVSMKALPLFWASFSGLDRKAPVSSVRVRVGRVSGLDPVARERLRQVADRIRGETGLDVDITIGASLVNRRVALPATASGTPPLLLNERWTKKGVAVAITRALDVKSVGLLILILGSSALSVALVALATVATRRRDLATLACMGWPIRRMHALLGTELAMLGLGAAVAGALVAWPVTQALDIAVRWWQVALVIPLGLALALAPGAAAVAAASRIAPLEAFRGAPAGRRSDLRIAVTGPASLGLMMTGMRPVRAVLAALAVAMGVAAAVFLAVVVGSFNGAVVGSYLGDAVALQVRGPDLAAAVILALLGVSAVSTLLFLALAEDAPAYAALQATGWTDWSIGRVLVTQSAAVSLLGAGLGCAGALLAAATVIGPLARSTIAIAVAVVLAALALCLAAAVVPAVLVRRLPTAQILARE